MPGSTPKSLKDVGASQSTSGAIFHYYAVKWEISDLLEPLRISFRNSSDEIDLHNSPA